LKKSKKEEPKKNVDEDGFEVVTTKQRRKN
jgi:hypothetical protein